MAPHLSPTEQDLLLKLHADGKTATAIHRALEAMRRRKGIDCVNVTVTRRFLKGRTHKRGVAEARGRKRTFTRANVRAMEKARRAFIAKTGGQKKANWDLLRSKARAPPADATTVARSFAREGVNVRLRRCREKPLRTKDVERERVDLCSKMARWPLRKFTDGIDLIIDNKRFPIPTTPDARAHLARQKMTSQLRTRGEGLQPNFTKPSSKQHRRNFGGSTMVCAGISNGRIALWEYCNKWNAQIAADMYKGPIMKALIKHRGRKTSYLMAEDNDPSGYKSGKAVSEKARLGIKTIDWPRYSPDLMPLDFCLWADIGRRLDDTAPKGRESIDAFKKRLRQVALRTSRATVVAAVGAMKKRAAQICAYQGKDIPRD